MAEKKYYDEQVTHSSAAAPITSAGILNLLTEPSQGTNSTNRIGDKTTGSSLQFTIDIYSPGTMTTSSYSSTRVIIFIWADDTPPTVADIIEDTAWPIQTPLNFERKIKRKILSDFVMTQFYAVGLGVNQSIRMHKKVVLNLSKNKVKNIINFNSTGLVNGIYLLLINEDASGNANTAWTCNYYSRYTFTDM